MVIRVGINGFGRIGRIIFRKCFEHAEIEGYCSIYAQIFTDGIESLAAINDPAVDVEYICYLIKFDSSHGKFKGHVTHTDNEIAINVDKKIKVFRERLPTKVPWHTADVHYVVEASGMFTCLAKASGHLVNEQVRRVIVTAPTMDIPMVILGVNDHHLKTEHKVLSCASSTLYCLAPIIKVLNDSFGVSEGFITSIHAMTPSLKPLDGLCLRGKHWRDHRSIHQNIIPASTGACKALGKIIPDVKDNLSGLAFRVPVVGVSVLDITIRLNSNTSIADIVKSVEKASVSSLKNIIKISNENAVSSDFIGDSNSCILDVDSSLELKPNFFKLICWYENEYSYACRVLDSIFFSEKQRSETIQVSKACLRLERRHISTNTSIDRKYNRGEPKSSCVSLEKPSRKSRSLNLKKSLSPPTALNNSKYDIAKVWNDDYDTSKNSIRGKCSSFFHCCVVDKPKPAKEPECIKTKERSKSIKTDLSKMLTITEDLLKKSYNKKIINLLSPHRCFSKSHTDDACLKIKLKSQENDTKSTRSDNKTQTKPTVLKECNILINNISKKSININNKEKTKSNRNVYNKLESSDLFEEINKTDKVESITKNKHVNIDKSINNQSNTKYSITRDSSCENYKDDILLQKRFLKTSNNDPKRDITIRLKDKPDTSETDLKACNKNVFVTHTSTSRTTYKEILQHKLSKTENAVRPILTDAQIICDNQPPYKRSNDTNNLKDLTIYSKNKNCNIDVVGEELKAHKITVPDVDIYEIPIMKNTQLPVEIEDHKVDTNSHDSSRNILVSSNVQKRRKKQDIYDKLDSHSATDSNDSFDVNERKSQIINITDLTTSLEDLARMDKICRIIEISDELSNELFSPLDNEDCVSENKQWSFKDLCDRIHLDSFCNKVFGETGR